MHYSTLAVAQSVLNLGVIMFVLALIMTISPVVLEDFCAIIVTDIVSAISGILASLSVSFIILGLLTAILFG